MSTFCQRSYHRNCQCRGVGGQKTQNIRNVVCERPLILVHSTCDLRSVVMQSLTDLKSDMYLNEVKLCMKKIDPRALFQRKHET